LVVKSFLAAYHDVSSVLGRYEGMPREHLIGIDFGLLREHRDEIVRMAPKSYRREVERLIGAILSNEGRMRDAEGLKDPLIVEYLQAWFEAKTAWLNPAILEGGRPAEPRGTTIEPWRLAEYFPVAVNYRADVHTHEGYLFLPAGDEPARVESYLGHEEILEELLKRAVKGMGLYDASNYAITIGGRTYKFDEVSFVRVLDMLGLWSEARRIIARRLAESVADVGGAKHAPPEDPYVVLRGGPQDFGVDMPEGYRDVVFEFKVETAVYKYPMVEVEFSARGGRLGLGLRREAGSPGAVKDVIAGILREVKAKVEAWKPAIDPIIEAAKGRGYEVSPGEEETPVYMLRKGDISVLVRVKDGGRAVYHFSISKEIGRRDISEYEIKAADEAYGHLISDVSVYGGRARVYGRVEGARSPEEVFIAVESISRSIDGLIRRYDEAKAGAKARVPKASTEMAVALHLLRLWPYHVNPDEVIGRDWGFIYTSVGRLLKRLDPEAFKRLKKRGELFRKPYMEEWPRDVARVLVEKGYVRLTPEGEVVVGGSTLRELLRSTGYFKEDVVEGLNFRVAARIAELLMPEGPTPDAYEKLGLATPQAVKVLIFGGGGELVPPEVLAWRFGGKTLWEQLEPGPKKYYVAHYADAHQLYRMLTVYRDTFGDVSELALKTLVKRSRSLATKYLAENAPHLIASGKPELYETDDGFAGVKVGGFVAQVAAIGVLEPGARKVFAVYHVERKVGFLVPARTVEEAVAKAEAAYPKFMEEFKKLMEMEVRLVPWRYEGGGFMLFSVLAQGKAFLARPGILKLLEKHVKAREEEKGREPVSISA